MKLLSKRYVKASHIFWHDQSLYRLLLLNNSCPLCFLLCSVLQFKIENGCGWMLLLGVAEWPPVRKELFIRFAVHVFRERLSNLCVCSSSLLVLRVGCGM